MIRSRPSRGIASLGRLADGFWRAVILSHVENFSSIKNQCVTISASGTDKTIWRILSDKGNLGIM